MLCRFLELKLKRIDILYGITKVGVRSVSEKERRREEGEENLLAVCVKRICLLFV